MTKQRTFEVNGEKITIKSRELTWMGNKAGYNVFINGQKYFRNVPTREEAEAGAYAKWVKEHK
jgi:hypothetical protein